MDPITIEDTWQDFAEQVLRVHGFEDADELCAARDVFYAGAFAFLNALMKGTPPDPLAAELLAFMSNRHSRLN